MKAIIYPSEFVCGFYSASLKRKKKNLKLIKKLLDLTKVEEVGDTHRNNPQNRLVIYRLLGDVCAKRF